uniref:Uncharacterized protein n=1 Tax=Rhizobium rhizogenes TaxID=359 RepID=A0A7S4ZUS7_RHIRH|nr:hypothetical protein pC5.8b_426 [Rhizobium rhizogenes]
MRYKALAEISASVSNSRCRPNSQVAQKHSYGNNYSAKIFSAAGYRTRKKC